MPLLARRLGDPVLWVPGVVAFAVRLAIVALVPVGYPGDLAGWVETARRVTLDGPAAAYAVLAPGSLYPPGFMVPLWVSGHLYVWCCSPEFTLGTRALDQVMLLGPIVADSAIAVLVATLARAWLGPPQAALAGLLYALCPAALTTVAWQGMVGDPYYGVLVLAAVVAGLRGRPMLATACLTAGVLVKPQALAFAPLVGLLVVRGATPRRLAASLVAAALVSGGVLLPFVLGGTLDSVGAAVHGMSVIHAYTQNSADNLWLLLQVGDPAEKVAYLDGAVPDGGAFVGGLSYQEAGLLAFASLYALVLARLVAAGGARAAARSGAVVGLGFFFLNTRMHVNYAFMAFPFVCAVAAGGGVRAGLALLATNVACLVDWNVLGSWPWPEGLPVHQASAVAYGLSLLLLCSLALLPDRAPAPAPAARRPSAEGARAPPATRSGVAGAGAEQEVAEPVQRRLPAAKGTVVVVDPRSARQ